MGIVRKNIFLIGNKIYFLDSNLEISEIKASKKDEELLQYFIKNSIDNSEIPAEIPKEFYKTSNSLFSKINFLGNDDIIQKIVPSFFKNCITSFEEADLIIYLDYFEPITYLQDLNKKCLSENKKLLIITVSLERLTIGPLVIPGQSSCYNCKIQRLVNNNSTLLDFEKISNEEIKRNICSFMQEDELLIAKGFLGRILNTLLFENTPSIFVDKIIDFNLQTLESSTHAILPYPDCDCQDIKWIY